MIDEERKESKDFPDKLWDSPPETLRELLRRLNLTYLYQERELWVGDGEGSAVPLIQLREKK